MEAGNVRRFEFDLQSLLDFRERQQEQAQAKTAAAEQQLITAQQLLQQLDDDLRQSIAAFYHQQHQTLSINTFKIFNNYLDKIKGEFAVQQDKVQQAEAHYTECRHELNDRAKNCKLVEHIKDKRWQNYKSQLLAEEQKSLDELGLQAYVRSLL
jgi:flagellar FliJ protein